MTAVKNNGILTGKLGKSVYEALKKDVLRGAFPPGFHLVERDIARRYQASRTPIRAALQRLETEGLLERRESRGFCVRLPDIRAALEILDVREAVEGMAARLAARNVDESRKKQFLELISQMEQFSRDNDAISYYRLCGELHRAIFSAAQNSTLHDLILKISAQSSMLHYKTLLLAERIAESISEHTAIVQAIVQGDEDEAERLIRRHIREIKYLIGNLSELNSMTLNAL